MMKMNEKILYYFAGKLTQKDKLEFETELENNAELKRLFDLYSLRLRELKVTDDININETYFINLLPRTRERIIKNRKKVLIPKLAFALPVVAVIIYFIFNTNSSDMFSKYVANLPDSSKQEIVSYIDNENNNIKAELMKESNAEELLDKAISNSIDIQNINVNSRFTYSDDYELLKKLSPEEADKIYANLVDKKIL